MALHMSLALALHRHLALHRPCVAAPSRSVRTIRMWSGQTNAELEITDVPIATLYAEYSDLTRMTEWSPSLESVVVDPEHPTRSVWVMRVPRGLRVASQAVGYPSPEIAWEAELDAPGPPAMSWTSVIRDEDEAADDVKEGAETAAAGVSRVGFVPSGSVAFRPSGPGRSIMTLTLSYSLPDPVAWWMLALIQSSLVQGIVRNRMEAGMQRFARTIRAEHFERVRTATQSTKMDADAAGKMAKTEP